MLDYGERLSRLELRGVPLPECDYRDVGVGARLYYLPLHDPGMGFDFYAVQWVAGDIDAEKWDNPQVECLVRGVAYYDGLRHLYMGDEATDNRGYIYYPDATTLDQLFAVLRELEAEHCRDAES